MQLTEQSTILWGQTPHNPKQMCRWMEKAGRTCYKSEDKITQGSSVDFIHRMLKSGHHSVLEHSNIVFKLTMKEYSELSTLYASLGERMAFHQIYPINKYGDISVYINGNFRAWLDTFANEVAMCDGFIVRCSQLFAEKFDFVGVKPFTLGAGSTIRNATYIYSFNEIPKCLRKYTVKHTTDRAMTHEIVRHRIDSCYSQESQRYVNYQEGIEFIRPVWATDLQGFEDGGEKKLQLPATATWIASMEAMEKVYISLIKMGMKPQQARTVLPNSCKTEIVVTRGMEAWKWFFHLRDHKACDPQMQYLAKDTHTQFVEEIFTKI